MVSPSVSDLRFGRTAPGICVRDIHAAHDFYSLILGFKKVFENGDPVGFNGTEEGSSRNPFEPKAGP